MHTKTIYIKSHENWQESTDKVAIDLHRNDGKLTFIKKSAQGQDVRTRLADYKSTQRKNSKEYALGFIKKAFPAESDEHLREYLAKYFHQDAIIGDVKILQSVMFFVGGFNSNTVGENDFSFEVTYDEPSEQWIITYQDKLNPKYDSSILNAPVSVSADESFELKFKARMCIPAGRNLSVPKTRIIEVEIFIENQTISKDIYNLLSTKPRYKNTDNGRLYKEQYNRFFNPTCVEVVKQPYDVASKFNKVESAGKFLIAHPLLRPRSFSSLSFNLLLLFLSIGSISFVLMGLISAAVIMLTGGLGAIPIIGVWLLLHLGAVGGIAALSSAMAVVSTSVLSLVGAAFIVAGKFINWLFDAKGKSPDFLIESDPSREFLKPTHYPSTVKGKKPIDNGDSDNGLDQGPAPAQSEDPEDDSGYISCGW